MKLSLVIGLTSAIQVRDIPLSGIDDTTLNAMALTELIGDDQKAQQVADQVDKEIKDKASKVNEAPIFNL